MEIGLLLSFLIGIILLLLLIMKFKIPAFISLLIASMVTASGAGMDSTGVIKVVQNGMGGTLGFVATVVGLGTLFGGILEKTNSAKVIANTLLDKIGEKRSSWALMFTGFVVAIPVFFDVGFIILFPIIHALHKKTKKSIIYYAVPLLAGLAVTHACIPPTPGPIAVAEILGASLGWVILLGFIIGLPMAYTGGILYGKYIGDRLDIHLSDFVSSNDDNNIQPSFGAVISIILIPIILILVATVLKEVLTSQSKWIDLLMLLGHPFSALIIANLIAWYFLGIKNNLRPKELLSISNKSLYPAGIIILVTGAGGVYKQTLIETGLGEIIAQNMQSWGLGIIVFAFLASLIIRVLQGSATVAMITSAGLVAPLLSSYAITPIQMACLVIAISSGATMFSHFNDSGFWLPKEYLQLTETQAIRTWTVASTIVGFTGAILSIILFYGLNIFG